MVKLYVLDGILGTSLLKIKLRSDPWQMSVKGISTKCACAGVESNGSWFHSLKLSLQCGVSWCLLFWVLVLVWVLFSRGISLLLGLIGYCAADALKGRGVHAEKTIETW